MIYIADFQLYISNSWLMKPIKWIQNISPSSVAFTHSDKVNELVVCTFKDNPYYASLNSVYLARNFWVDVLRSSQSWRLESPTFDDVTDVIVHLILWHFDTRKCIKIFHSVAWYKNCLLQIHSNPLPMAAAIVLWRETCASSWRCCRWMFPRVYK